MTEHLTLMYWLAIVGLVAALCGVWLMASLARRNALRKLLTLTQLEALHAAELQQLLKLNTLRDSTARKHAEEAQVKAGALQNAIFNSANFSSIATDARGVIQIFNVGAERMLGYTAVEVLNTITPADISDPQEVIARARALSAELDTPIAPGFEALVFKASRGIEDIYELTYIRKDGSRFPAVVSVTALRDDGGAIIGYLLIGTDNTARRQAEDALRTAGALQSAIFNSANFSSIATDARGVIQIFNVGAERMLGYAAAEVLNTITPADISDPQEVIARARALSAELDTPIAPGFEALVFKASRGIEDIYELTYIRKDGSRFPAVVSVTALRDDGGAIIGYLLIGTDNTARKRAEEALLKSGALQSAIFNSANFSSIATDARGVIQIFNVGAERMLGYTALDVLNTITPADISDPQEVVARARALSAELGTPIAPGFEALVFKASRGIEDIYELTYIRKDGSRFPAVVSVTALRDAEGAIIGYLLIGTDNTARKQVEADRQKLDRRLRDQQFYTRSLIESNIDALITTDPSGYITDVNKQMEALTGRSRDELIGAPFKSCFTDPQRADESIRRVLAEKTITDYELSARARDNKITVVSYNATTFYDRERTLQGVVAVARDVTERNRLAHVLLEQNVELASAKQVAEKANLAKSEFLATMSHEIRTPMNGVIGMIDVLQQSNLNPAQVEMINIIHDSAFALLAVINDILDFSKIEAKKLDIESIPMSVAEVVESACEAINHMALKKAVELTLFVDPAIPAELLGDPGRLRQVLINLTNNAIKFSSGQDRLGRVSVRSLLTSGANGQVGVAFHVADNGIGIDAATRERLFTAFIQADTSTTRNFGGTGLGLAISGQLVDIMGGTIAVSSELGKGSVFSVQLPFAGANAAPGVAPEPFVVADLNCLVFGRPDSLADDMSAYLRHAHARVECARNEAQALQWLLRGPAGLSIVLVDDVGAEALQARLRAVMRPDQDLRFALIGRGRRRRVRINAEGLLSVDGNLLTRKALLETVAVTAGRSKAPDRQIQPTLTPLTHAPVSHEDARRQGSLILVAEDNEYNQKVVLQQLMLLGRTADIVNNGQEALVHWQSGAYCMLITDLHMPLMDGYQLTTAIREVEAGKTHLPIIAFTANALKGEAEHCLAMGMDDYLSKPVQLAQLRAMLDRWQPEVVSGLAGLAVEPDGAKDQAASQDDPQALVVTEHAPLDVRVLEALIGNDADTITQFVNDFHSTAAQVTAELLSAHAAGQIGNMAAQAHKLKSSARAVGALQLGELCAGLELAGKAKNTQALAALLPAFAQETERVSRFIRNRELAHVH
jgi:PAS domain S-box-containing protein